MNSGRVQKSLLRSAGGTDFNTTQMNVTEGIQYFTSTSPSTSYSLTTALNGNV